MRSFGCSTIVQRKKFMLYVIGRNIMKYHRFVYHEIEKYEGKKEQKVA